MIFSRVHRNMKGLLAGLGLCIILYVSLTQLVFIDSPKTDSRADKPPTGKPELLSDAGNGTLAKVPKIGVVQEPTSERVLVVYAYVEVNDGRHDIRKSNLQFFIDFAVGGKHQSDDVDYVIVINGYNCTVDIPDQENTFVVARENVGYDACAWKAGVDYMRKRYGQNRYKYFVFLNSSVKGPFIPAYANDKHWTKYFTKYLNNEVKLVGTSICCSKKFPVHIQSMFVVTSVSGLALIEHMLVCYKQKQAVIGNVEIGVSQFLLKNGYNIASVLKQWEDHDFRDKQKTEEMCRKHNSKMNGDPYYQNAYYDGIDISPFEVIFFKNNRGVNQKVHDVYSNMIQEWGEKYAPKRSTKYIGKSSKNYIHL